MKSVPVHSDLQNPSAWVLRFAPLVSQNGSVLDLAAGRGRHGRLFLKRGNQVTLVDRSVEGLRDLENEERAEVRKSMVSTGDRSAKIRTYNYPQGRVTDHRINLTLYKLNDIMDGDLSEVIEALMLEDQKATMEIV